MNPMNPDEQPTTSKSTAELVFTLVWFILLFAGIPFTLPKFMAIYKEMMPDEPLPRLTSLFCAIPPVAYIGVMIGGIAILLGLHFTVRSPQTCQKIYAVVALLCALALIVYLITVFMPLTGSHGILGGLRGS